MTKTVVKKVLFICFLVLSVVWVGFIFSNSIDNGTESGEKSSAVTEAINEGLAAVGVEKPVTERDVRTAAHFSEFLVLAALLSPALLLCPLSDKLKKPLYSLIPILSVPVCFLIACIDEFIQSFSPGRAMQFSDVLVDTLGALCSAVIFTLVCLAVTLISSKKRKKLGN